jgi:hypothetical protein
MLTSPAMTYATSSFELEQGSGSCCADADHSDHPADEKGHCAHDQNDCCGNNCPNNDCCLHLNVYQPLTFQMNQLESVDVPKDVDSSEKNDSYNFFHYKELIYSVWQPPKLIS